MPTVPLAPIIRQLRRVAVGPDRTRSDADLLGQFVRSRDEFAFEELIRRHGPIVWGVCTRMLADHHAAEDAFQATFFVLARRAGAIGRPEALGCWLCGVARRIAGKVRKRESVPAPSFDRACAAAEPLEALTARELLTVLDDELNRLPERLRGPLVLCYLEGRTRDEASAALGWSLGTLKRRLESGRALLRICLERRGVALPAALLAAVLAGTRANAGLPFGLTAATARAATLFIADGLTGSAPAALAAAAMQTIIVTKLRVASAVAIATFVVTICLTGLTGVDQPGSPSQPPKPPVAREAEPRLDRYGDPLPAGAMVRMGTTRLRHVSATGNYITGLFNPDGRSILTHNDASLRMWDIQTGQLRWQWEGEKGLGEARFAPGGKTLAVSSGTGLFILDSLTGKPIRRLSADPRSFHGMAFSPDGRTLATQAYRPLDSTEPLEVTPATRAERIGIESWDVETGKSLAVLPTQGMMPRHCGFTPDGKSLVVFGFVEYGRHRLMRFDLANHKAAPPIEVPFPNGQLSGDGLLLAVRAPGKGLVRFWDTATGKDVGGIDEHISAFSFVDGGRKFVGTKYARGGDPARLSVWDLKTFERLDSCPVGPESPTQPRLSPDGRTAMIEDIGRMVHLYDFKTGTRLHNFASHDGAAGQIAFTRDGRELVTTGLGDGAVRVWNAETGEQNRVIATQPRQVYGLRLTVDGKRFLAAGDGLPTCHDLATGGEVCRFAAGIAKGDPTVDHLSFRAICPQPGSRTVIGFADSINYVAQTRSYFQLTWNATGGEPIAVKRLSADEIEMDFSPDGRSSATTLRNGPYSSARPWNWPPIFTKNVTVVIHDLPSGRTIASIPQPNSYAHCCAWSADGQTLATLTSTTETKGDQENQISATVHVWEIRTGRESMTIPLCVPVGPRQEPSALAISADGRLLAVSRPDGRIFLFDAPTGKELAIRANPGVPVHCLEFRHDGRALASGNDDGTALIWDIADVHPAEPTLNKSEIEARWANLAGEDARKAHIAISDLAANPAATVKILAERLRPAEPISPDVLRQRVAELNHAQFRIRQIAERELARDIDQAEPVLRAALKENPPAEQRRRIEALLSAPPAAPKSGNLRALRSIEVLERIGNPESQRLLEQMAGGAVGAQLTRDAKAALERLAK